MNCAVCGREERLDGSGEGCARAWLCSAVYERATSMRGPTSHDVVDCERAGRLAALARAEKAERERDEAQRLAGALKSSVSYVYMATPRLDEADLAAFDAVPEEWEVRP